MEYDDEAVVFSGEDSAVGYAVLLVVVVIVASSLAWWFPGSWRELLQPWQRVQWTHVEAMAYALWVAIIAGGISVVGAYLSDRGRSQKLRFDIEERRVQIREWWRGIEVELDVPLSLLEIFEFRRPAERRNHGELGVFLKNGAYWRLRRDRDAEELASMAQRLNREILPDADEEESRKFDLPQRIDLFEEHGALQYRWATHERQATRLCLAVAAGLFAVATIFPQVLVFQGALGWLMIALFIGSALFGVPLFFGGGSRGIWPFLLGWFATGVWAVFWVGANGFYFVVATVGVAIFGKSAVHLLFGFFRPEEHVLRLDEGGGISEDGRRLRDQGRDLEARQLEGALVNVTEIRPIKIVLLRAGEGQENKNRYRGLGPDDPREGAEPVELKATGLSPFEATALSLSLDERLLRQ